MTKKIFLILALLCLPLWVLGAWANNPIKYIERSWDNGQKKIVETEKTITDYTILTGSDDWTRLGAEPADDNDHYYVVTGNVSYKVLNVYGRAHLILCDGAMLTCTGGIMVEKDHHDAKLFIYSQSYGTNQGKLKVTNSYDDAAGIGSSEVQKCGEITIHGGNLDITGGKDAAGIGGGGLDVHLLIFDWSSTQAEDGITTIFGGTVKAQGGDYGAGIGGGARANGGKLYIYGGDVTAIGGETAAGVGGGGSYEVPFLAIKSGGLGSKVYVYGGKLTAQGGYRGAGIGTGSLASSEEKDDRGELNVYEGATVIANGGKDGAGIGGGRHSIGIITNIFGGTVTATGGDYGAGIGGGNFSAKGAKTNISGGTVTAKGGVDAAGIGGGEMGRGGETRISGGFVRAEGSSYGAGIGGGEDCYGSDTYITGGTVIAIAGEDCKGREDKGGSAIGCGQAISNKDAGNRAFKLEIGSNMMVTGGDAEDNIERVFSSPERNPACRWRNYVKIEPCPHIVQNGDEAITFSIVDASYHDRYCRYCQTVIRENHATTGDCLCGMTGYSFTTYVPVANPEIDGYGYEMKQTYIVKDGNEFYLPECDVVPTGYKFLGWEMNPAPENYDKWAAVKGGDIGGDDKLAAGTSVKSLEGMSNATFYARYLYDLKDEWSWSDDNSSCWLKISGDALMYTENVEFKQHQITEQHFDDHIVYSISYTYTLRGYDYNFSTKKSVPFELTLQDDADNSAAIEKYAGKTATAYLTGRTLYTDGLWNIICLPFDLNESDFDYLEIKEVKTLASSQLDKATGTLKLNFEEAKEIKAGKPYLVRWDFDDDYREYYSEYQSRYITFDKDANIIYYEFEPAVIDGTLRPSETEYVDFIGSFSPVSLTANDRSMLYLGAGDKLNFPSADMTVGSCRAVFRLKGLTADDLPHGARSIILNFGDEATVAWDDLINVTVTEPNTLAQELGLEADVSWDDDLGNDVLQGVRGDYSHVNMLKVTGPIGLVDMALLKYLAGYCPWTDSRNYAGHLEYLDLYDADIKETSVENELPKHALQRAYNLKTLILPKTCRKVNECALQECESLKTLVLGDDMEDFNWNALDDDAMLTRMYILAKKKVDISSELPIWSRLCNDYNPTFDAFYVRPSLYQDYIADANYIGSSWQGTNNVTTGFFNDDASFCAFASHGTATQDELAAVTSVKGWFDGHKDVCDLWPLRYTKVNSLDKATIAPLKELEQIALPESLNDMEDGLFENAKHLRYADFLLCESTDVVAGLRDGGFQKLGINTYQTLAYVPATYGETDETNVVVTVSGGSAAGTLRTKTYRLTDSLSYVVPYAFEAEQIENARIMQKDAVPYTICLPYKLEVPTGARAYGLSQRTGSKLVFEEVKGELEAMKPYLLKVVGNKRQRLNSANLNTKISQTIPANGSTTYGRQVDVLGYTLCGTFDALSNGEAAELGAYVLQADGNWHPVMTDTDAHQRAVIPPFRAYLLPNASNAAARIGMELMDGDNATDIDTIETIDADGTHRYYDLQGREVGGSTKGIIISNGKKVKVKSEE